MKKLVLPALFCAALLAGTSACTDNKTQADNTATANNTASDNAMRNGTDGSANATNDGDTTGMGDTATDRTAPMGMNGNSADPNGPTAPHKDDPEFMKSAAHSDQNEIQLSKLVLAKGVTGMAKDHANMMIKDHTASTAQLKPIAQKKGVTLPTDMDAEHKAIAEKMQTLSGKELEQQYMQQMVLDHQKTLNTMKAHDAMTQDADLKGFIAKVTPVVQAHLDMFQKHGDMKM
jgi:putative membrane protein